MSEGFDLGREMFEACYKMASLVRAGLDPTPISPHRFAIDNFEAGFAVIRSGASGKVVLERGGIEED